MFQVDTAEEISNVPPCEMRNKFTVDEVRNAVKKLKAGKAAGINELKAEQLKHGPDLILCEISDILNQSAASGSYPREIKLGVFISSTKAR